MVPILLAFAALLISCEKPPRQPEVPAIPLYQDDGEIERIAENARNTLPVFFRYLTGAGGGANGGKGCYIKYPFLADEGSGVDREQVWLTGIQFANGRYYGVLANAPRHLGGMKKGDRVIFDMEAVTDWMYVRDGKIIGGESIKYLLEKTPEERRSDRERELLRMLY